MKPGMEKEQLKSQLADLIDRQLDLQSELSKNRGLQANLNRQIWEIDNEISVGDDVIVGSGKNEKRGRYEGYQRSSPVVRYYRKDGTLGVKHTALWFMDKIRKA